MKILITGGAGFVASYLVKECLDNGDEVIVTLRWNEDLIRIQPYLDKVKVEYVELTDLSSVIRCINKHRPDVISHLAAQSWVPYSMDNPIYTMKNNVESTLNILESVRIIQEVEYQRPTVVNIDKRSEHTLWKDNYNPLIHICSSSEFYGKVDSLPITENHKANPGNVYGISKVAGDFLAQIYSKYYDLNILITRMFTHTGRGRTMMSAENYYAGSIAELEKNGHNVGKKYTIFTGDETAMNSLRTWADVRDACKNYYELFKNQRTGIYNISGETTKTIREVLDYLISISSLNQDEIILVEDPKFSRAINVDKQIVDISKFKQDNDWSNEISFEELMQSLLNHRRERV